MWLCLLMCMVSEPSVLISESGVFQPLNRSEVRVAENGEVYILNFNEATCSLSMYLALMTCSLGSLS